MLASPLLPPPPFGPQHSPDDYRPAKDLDTFNNLLPPPVEFVEGSSSGAYAIPEGKYKPINVPQSPKSPRHEKSSEPASIPLSTQKPVSKPDSQLKTPKTPVKSLYPAGIDITWPPACNIGSGLHNTGNTCFLNSALQCLLHTPPLLRVISSHKQESCRMDKGFCMACGLRQVATKSFSSRSAFAPTVITTRLQAIAKHMRRGRQEDTHEFLRYAIDALQKSCLAGYPQKIDPKLAETTWVHKIFGGRLRSRVTCRDCGYNSDTFDRILDLSLDIFKSDTVKDALGKFVAIDCLKGADKYKCEKCKKHVTAEKRFTIHDAPMVLTVHLKRFSPMGRKIGHNINYDEQLSVQPFMSDGQYGPTYSLYGVICHAGSGPNSGHYYAFVKSRDGKWWEMNDEMVSPISGPPLHKKSAYMLFYLRAKGQGLEEAVKSASSFATGPRQKPRLSQSMKAKERDENMEDGENKGGKGDRPFIGPLLPSPSINGDSKKTSNLDPQAASLKSKIEKARKSMSTLSQYKSDDEESDNEDVGEKVEESKENAAEAPSSSMQDVEMKPSSPPPQSSSPVKEVSGSGIPPSSFYGPAPKKRKSPDTTHGGSPQKRPFQKMQYSNPFNRVTYSSKKKRRVPRGL